MSPRPGHQLQTIETERLVLRPFTLDDARAAYELNLDPEVTRFTHDGGVQSLAVVTERIAGIIEDYAKWGYGRWAVIHRAAGRFIGFSGLKYVEDISMADLGFRFQRDMWGQGFATESGLASLHYGFEVLELDRIAAQALSENRASLHVMEKLGMELTSRSPDGGAEVVTYVLDRSTWLARART